jgi:predicted RNase H-like nuclease (RuvC/YqgF family)
MNPLFKKLYKHKKTRVRDPNTPPPPNLFSTVRDLKVVTTNVSSQEERIRDLQQRVERLENKNRNLEYYIEYLRSKIIK